MDTERARAREDQNASIFDDREQAFVKFLGQGNDRAALSRKVLEEADGSGCHWGACLSREEAA